MDRFVERKRVTNPNDAIIPPESFEDFYQKFDTVKDIVKSQLWQDVYSQFYWLDDFELNINTKEKNYEDYTPEEQELEIERCVYSFSYFCHKYVKIMHPIHGMIPFVLYSYQRRVIEEFEENRFNIISKFRQGGLTTVAVLWGLWKCLFQLDQQIMVLSKTDREAIAAGDIVERALENLPNWMYKNKKKGARGKVDQIKNKHEKKFKDTDSSLWFYTPEAARGKSITVLIIDEAAFIKDMDTHWKAMYPVVSTGGKVIVISTVKGYGNWYQVTYHEAQAGKNEFNVIDLDYWEHPQYIGPDWVEKTRANMGEKGWRQEILRDFLGSGDPYIPLHILEELDIKTRNDNPTSVKFPAYANETQENLESWEEGALWIWKHPVEGREYILSADCAEGVGSNGDNSAFEVLDVASLEQVAEFYSNKVQPHIFAQIINEFAYVYHTALVVVENAGPGGAVLSNLQHDLAYENLYYEAAKGRNPKPGMKMTPGNRSFVIESIQHRLSNRSLVLHSRRLVRELRTFNFNPKTQKAEAQKGSHDDAIIAMCLALIVRDEQMRGIPVGSDVPKEMVQIFKSDVYEEIRKEILKDTPQSWLMEEEPILISNNEDNSSMEAYLNLHRKNDKLLKEFGW